MKNSVTEARAHVIRLANYQGSVLSENQIKAKTDDRLKVLANWNDEGCVLMGRLNIIDS